MAINVKKEPPTAIDNELFQFYTRYQMCQIKKSTSLWNNSKEKEAMLTILTEFENVDGNTLRLIVNQIFENSIQKFNNSDKESEGMNVDTTVIHSAPTNETGATKMEALESKQDNCEDELEEASTSDSHAKNMISVVPLVENEAPIIVPKNIQEILSLPSIEEIQHMTTHIERSKYILLKRMRVVDESFKFKASAQNASYTVRVYNLLGNSRSPLYQSQLNLIAYRFGKVVQHETLYSSQNVKEVERKLYGDLIRMHTSTISCTRCSNFVRRRNEKIRKKMDCTIC
ncbi:hypothetical protein BD408DRAFT_425507 [Parasitella parasitica]|nr:hypothetical protein BD408DRAFT_425507 [Parasitella parasitica]